MLLIGLNPNPPGRIVKISTSNHLSNPFTSPLQMRFWPGIGSNRSAAKRRASSSVDNRGSPQQPFDE